MNGYYRSLPLKPRKIEDEEEKEDEEDSCGMIVFDRQLRM